jgi:HTH-type transcriptional regulator/antitoxin HigA
MKQGIISICYLTTKNKPGVVKNLWQFFGVASPIEWQNYYAGIEVAFSRTCKEQNDFGAIAAWLQFGEIEVEKLDCSMYLGPAFSNCWSILVYHYKF